VIRPNDPGAQDDFSTAGRHGHGLPAIWNATVEMHPKSGPANTVLVEQDNPSWKPGDDPDLQYPKTWRFWIAPERSYLVMRCERLVPGVGKDGIASGYVIEELTESPDGQWYPAVVRRLRAARFSHGQTRDHIQRFYYDFSAPVPDSMFEAK
jgi:hypothetical protein